MGDLHAARTMTRSGKMTIALVVLALVLVAAVPVALLTGIILMLLGHVVGGLALFGGSILAAGAAVALAAWNGVRRLRDLVNEVRDGMFPPSTPPHTYTLDSDDYSRLG